MDVDVWAHSSMHVCECVSVCVCVRACVCVKRVYTVCVILLVMDTTRHTIPYLTIAFVFLMKIEVHFEYGQKQ